MEVFKRELDKFQASIPDQSGTLGYIAARPAAFNSITSQLEYLQQCRGVAAKLWPFLNKYQGCIPLLRQKRFKVNVFFVALLELITSSDSLTKRAGSWAELIPITD